MKRVKRIATVILCMVIIAGVFPVNALGADVVASGKCGDNVTFTLTNDGMLTISGSGKINDNGLMFYSTKIRSVVIESGVTEIGSAAFYGCVNITDVKIPGTVTEIGAGAFQNCTSLSSVSIYDGVASIGVHTFSGCSSLTSISLPDSLTSIETYAFKDCTALKSINIPSGAAKIGSDVFCGCTALTHISVDEGNPYYCSDEKGVMYNKNKTEILTVPAKLTGNYVIPKSVTKIGDDTFSGCSALTGITIPDSVIHIGESAFSGCSGLTRITIPDSVRYILDYAFSDCTGLKSVSLSNRLTRIYTGLFSGCTSLTDISLPDNLLYIEDNVFAGCTALSRISVDENNTAFSSDETGVVLNKSKTALMIVPPGISGNYTIPSTVTEIANGAFYGCERLTSITIPGSVKQIQNGSFNNSAAKLIFTGNTPETDGGIYENDSFTQSAVIAVYPVNNGTWTEAARQSFGDNIIWVPDDYNTHVVDTPKASSETLEGAESSNVFDNNYISVNKYGNTVNSCLTYNQDGSFTRVEHIGDSVVIEEYDSSFKLSWKKTIAMELPVWGGFYSGSEYNFFVFGQDNLDEDDSKPVVRIVRYTKNWYRIDCTELCGANTIRPFDAGSLRMTEKDDVLYIHTCHQIYTMDDGLNHQTNMYIAVSIPYMKIISANYHVGGAGYVSHSFNQFILSDGDYIVRLDHGDAYPRAINISRFTGAGNNAKEAEVFKICGVKGNNNTGVAIGGFETSDSAYLTAGSSVEQDPYNFNYLATRNIFVLATDKDSLETTTNWLTHYGKDDPVMVLNPHLVKVSDREFVLLWSEIRDEVSKTYYVRIDGMGNAISEVYSTFYQLSDCKPVVRANELIWYTTGDKYYSIYYTYERGTTEPVFYALDYTKQAESYQKGDVNRDGSVSNSDLILVARHVVNLITLTGEQFTLGDMNNDGAITNTDIITVARKIVGL